MLEALNRAAQWLRVLKGAMEFCSSGCVTPRIQGRADRSISNSLGRRVYGSKVVKNVAVAAVGAVSGSELRLGVTPTGDSACEVGRHGAWRAHVSVREVISVNWDSACEV